MTVVAKCNIVDVVLKDLAELQYGFTCPSDNTKIFIENYLEYLNCADIYHHICYPAPPCEKDQAVNFTCNFNLLSISATLNPPANPEADIIFDIKVLNYVGGTLPFKSYLWTFESDDFELVGANGLPEVKLKLKEGQVLETMTSLIGVTIVDANDCTDSVSCYLTPDGMQCGFAYQPCFGPEGLEVISLLPVVCSRPMGLITGSYFEP